MGFELAGLHGQYIHGLTVVWPPLGGLPCKGSASISSIKLLIIFDGQIFLT